MNVVPSTIRSRNAHALLIARHVARVDPGVRCEFTVTDVTAGRTDEHPLVLDITLTGSVNRHKCAGTLRVTDRAFGPDRDPQGRDDGKVEFIGFARSVAQGSHEQLQLFAAHVFGVYVDSNGAAPDPNEPTFQQTTWRRAFWQDGTYVIQ